ncbi:MAG: N-acetylmuramoyl-L-alanine amidase [Micromonosporaceae bacterium]
MSSHPISRRKLLLATAAGVAAAPLASVPAWAVTPKLYIDPGHGGTDSGAVGNGLREKDLTLAISLQMRDYLKANYVVDIRMSRTTDVSRSLSYRSSDANSWGAHRFVSVHINAGGGTGFESYRYTSTNSTTQAMHSTLHSNILSTMRSVASVTDRGMKTANFHVLRETNMPAILTENLFIDRSYDAGLLKRADFIAATARGHAIGIAKHMNLQPSGGGYTTTVDNATTGRFTASANWGTSSYSAGKYGADYRYANPQAISDAAWFKVAIPSAGSHRVEVWYPSNSGYNNAAPYVVAASGGNQTVHVDQRTGGGAWRSIGTFSLAAGDYNAVGVSRWTNGTGYVIADAVRVTRV